MVGSGLLEVMEVMDESGSRAWPRCWSWPSLLPLTGGATTSGARSGRSGRSEGTGGPLLGAAMDADAPPRAGVVTVGVRLGRVVVDNFDRLDVHGEGRLRVVRPAAGPLDGARRIRWVAASPDAQPHAHRRLRVARAALGGGVGQGAHESAVDVPGDVLFGPFHGVRVEVVLRLLDGGPGEAVIGRGVAFTEVIGLDPMVIAA